jgi:hypothetical protein
MRIEKYPETGFLANRKACLRAVWALKAGRPPREGVRFLTVGMDSVVRQLDTALERVADQKGSAPFLVLGDYGDGKTHTLRLLAELAGMRGFTWAVVALDKEQRIGPHKPAWLFRRLLWELRWNYPELDFSQWEHVLEYEPTYPHDRSMRECIVDDLGRLAADLRSQGRNGLVLCLDELENRTLLSGRQVPIYREVIARLILARIPGCLLVFGSTYAAGVVTGELVGTQIIRPPVLEKAAAAASAVRLRELHARAFSWSPPLSEEHLAEHAWSHAAAVPSGRWRAFVQAVITHLEVAHQAGDIGDLTRFTVPKATPRQQALGARSRSLEQPIPLRAALAPSLRVGDFVEIISGPYHGWRARVIAIDGRRVHLSFGEHVPLRVQIDASRLRRVSGGNRP